MNIFRKNTVVSPSKALCKAAEEGNIEKVKTLLQEDGKVNDMYKGFTPFHVACEFGKEEVVRFLLQQPNIKIDILDRHEGGAKDPKGTALHLACRNNQKGVTRLLLS